MNLQLLLRPSHSLRINLCLGLESIIHPFYVQIMKRSKTAWGHSRATLQHFERGTLGHDLYRFLRDHDLEIIPKLELHDVFHVLFELQPTVLDEIRLQILLLGNGYSSLYAWFSAIIGGVLFPEYYLDFKNAYQKGKKCRRCTHWRFEYLLQEPTNELRAFIVMA